MYPIYVFGSGSIQIGHFLLFIFSIMVLIIFGIPIDKYFYAFLFFLIYCYLVNIFYFYYDLNVYNEVNLNIFKNPTIKYLNNILFLSYNFILTISLITYFKSQKHNVILYGLSTAIMITLFYLIYQIFIYQNVSFRFEGFFNNPNQLGYFCSCCFSLIYLFYRNLYIPYYFMVLLLIIVFLFSILTLSKASYIALFCCGIFAIKPFNYKYSKIVEIIIFLLFIFVFIFFFQQISDTHIFSRTLNMLTETDSSLEVRGYKVFLNATSLQHYLGWE